MKTTVTFQGQSVILLEQGDDRVWVAPQFGARILRWTHGEREVLEWPEDADWDDVLKVRGGNPILFPFVARHFLAGKMGYWQDGQGRVFEMPQHGFARQSPFQVVDDGADSRPVSAWAGGESTLRMRLSDSEATRVSYPFAFVFDVVVTLQGSARLAVRFETTNTGSERLPYYAGHHFYFAIPHGKRADWLLDAPCVSWGRQTADGSIDRQTAQAASSSLADPQLIDRYQIQPTESDVVLHHRFEPRRLVLELSAPDSVPWYAVTTWAPSPTHDCYCIEPWLGLPNAIEHGLGLRWLEPGASEAATCAIDASAF